MKTQAMFMTALLIACFNLTACGHKDADYSAPADGSKTPSLTPAPQTQVVVIKNSVLGDIATYTAAGLSTDLKLECTLTGGTVFCNALVVLP